MSNPNRSQPRAPRAAPKTASTSPTPSRRNDHGPPPCPGSRQELARNLDAAKPNNSPSNTTAGSSSDGIVGDELLTPEGARGVSQVVGEDAVRLAIRAEGPDRRSRSVDTSGTAAPTSTIGSTAQASKRCGRSRRVARRLRGRGSGTVAIEIEDRRHRRVTGPAGHLDRSRAVRDPQRHRRVSQLVHVESVEIRRGTRRVPYPRRKLLVRSGPPRASVITKSSSDAAPESRSTLRTRTPEPERDG